jgi:hypothetical protein
MHQAHGCTRHVDGHVAATHHDHSLAQFNFEIRD